MTSALSAVLVFALIVFVALYPRRRAWASRRVIVALMLAGALVASVVVASRIFVATAGDSGMAAVLATALAMLVLAYDPLREPAGPVRSSLLLVVVAFLTYNLYASSANLVVLALGRPLPFVYIAWILWLNLLVSAVALGLLLRPSRGPLPPRERAVVVGLGSAAVVSGIAAAFFPGDFASSSGVAGFFRGLWRFVVPLLAAYAIVRHQLFDIDLRVKWTIRRGAVATAFIGVFFVAAQLAQNYLTERQGWAAGGVVAGLMLFAIAPLQRMAERVANAAMPHVREPTKRGESEDTAAYRAAVEMALADPVVTWQEEKALARIAERLGIPAERAWEIREQVERDMGAEPVKA